MIQSNRSIWTLLLAIALALPAIARFSDDDTGGGSGGGITILPSANVARMSVRSFSGYQTRGVTVSLPINAPVFTAIVLLPGSSVPAATLSGTSSTLHIPGTVLAQYYEQGLRRFSVKIRTLQGAFAINVTLTSESRIDLEF